MAALVAEGRLIFTQTPQYAPRYVGNTLSCASCHLDAGTRANAAPMWGAVGLYPRYQAKTGQVVTFEQRLQQCFVFSEAGSAPALDSRTILALSAYAHSLARGRVMGDRPAGAGFAVLPATSHDGDPAAGAATFKTRCAACHGANGAGSVGFPALWGWNSYRRGAGMSNPSMAARFIAANMPPGGPALSADEARDVAAFIDSQWRRPDPRKGVLGWMP